MEDKEIAKLSEFSSKASKILEDEDSAALYKLIMEVAQEAMNLIVERVTEGSEHYIAVDTLVMGMIAQRIRSTLQADLDDDISSALADRENGETLIASIQQASVTLTDMFLKEDHKNTAPGHVTLH